MGDGWNNGPKSSDIVLIRFNLDSHSDKNEVIKVVRKLFGWGLKESKKWVEGEYSAEVTYSNKRALSRMLGFWGIIEDSKTTLKTGW